MAGDRRLDNDLNLRRAKMNSGLAKCLITISMEIPSCDRGRCSARPSRRWFSHGTRRRGSTMRRNERADGEKVHGAREANLIKSARCLAEISLMKTFVRCASGAELSADFMEKETNERASARALVAFMLPFFRLRDNFPTVFVNIP